VVTEVLEESGLSEDQPVAARIVPSSDRALLPFVRPAGTGTSYTLAAFAKVHQQRTGDRVIASPCRRTPPGCWPPKAWPSRTRSLISWASWRAPTRLAGTCQCTAAMCWWSTRPRRSPTADLATIQAVADRNGARVIAALLLGLPQVGNHPPSDPSLICAIGG